MNGRILRIELRRSAAATSGALVAFVGIAGLYTLYFTESGDLWSVQWTMLAAFQRVVLLLLWPLALGAGAWIARRDRRTRMEELLLTTPRSVRSRMMPAATALGLCLGLGYLLIFGAGAVVMSPSYSHLGWVPISVVGVVSLVAAGWLGLGIGRLLPSTYTPPLLTVASFLVLVLPVQLRRGGGLNWTALLAPNLSSYLDEVTTVDGSATLGQAAWFVGLAVAGLVLAVGARHRGAVLAVVPALVGLVVAVPFLSAAPKAGLRVDPAAVAEICTTDGGPVVCVQKVHEHGLAELTGPARRALELLARLPDPPTSVHEVRPARPGPQPTSEVWFSGGYHQAGTGWIAQGDALVGRVLEGAGTRPCGHEGFDDRSMAAAWLWGSYPLPGGELSPQLEAERMVLWERLRSLPPAEQLQRVLATRAVGLACTIQGNRP
ncbi:hypothetical protein [Umezawaea tangerina]|uniref:ABC-type transport system involved in multi-copper enzyme maturation permease subunit n=1 Tax=Umezawaea tangerina TaxID=84725 RepID=A0A2T0SXW6_9PSEU|nr:hypothetical protein [Umezawaea tangerina]PRY38255.1 hypothetical protein CLV43_109476 [Umezawaea tangerina]